MKKNTVLVLLVLVLAVIGYAMYPSEKLPAGVRIDKLEVYKANRLLVAYADGKAVKKYAIALGGNPAGHKQIEGDSKTPEGTYTINDKNPNSDYHKNLGVSYPNAQDQATAQKMGKSAGGDIKLHGLRNGTGWLGRWHRALDWTQGCMALTDDEIDELYAHTPVGTPIIINP